MTAKNTLIANASQTTITIKLIIEGARIFNLNVNNEKIRFHYTKQNKKIPHLLNHHKIINKAYWCQVIIQCPPKTYLKQSEINRKVKDDIYKTNRQNNEHVEANNGTQ